MDTIREEDKYGNTGDRHQFIGRGVVAGFEGFSRILNKVLDVSHLQCISSTCTLPRFSVNMS